MSSEKCLVSKFERNGIRSLVKIKIIRELLWGITSCTIIGDCQDYWEKLNLLLSVLYPDIILKLNEERHCQMSK